MPMASIAFASSVTRTCSYDQLDVVTASPSGAYAATGHHGIPFYIVNISGSACSLTGYPRISFAPQSFHGSTLRVVHGGGMIFAAVKPHLVTINAGATASFGLDFVDAYDQQDPSGSPCLTQNADVLLPVRSNPSGQYFRPVVSFNFCYAGFRVALTSIESGPIPKRG